MAVKVDHSDGALALLLRLRSLLIRSIVSLLIIVYELLLMVYSLKKTENAPRECIKDLSISSLSK